MVNLIKENWNRTDETCPSCGQVTKRVRGITKQNLKRLVKPKFDINELVITFILIMIILLAFAYKNETQMCRDWLEPMFESDYDGCLLTCNQKCEMIRGIQIQNNQTYTIPKLNLNMNATNETNRSV